MIKLKVISGLLLVGLLYLLNLQSVICDEDAAKTLSVPVDGPRAAAVPAGTPTVTEVPNLLQSGSNARPTAAVKARSFLFKKKPTLLGFLFKTTKKSKLTGLKKITKAPKTN